MPPRYRPLTRRPRSWIWLSPLVLSACTSLIELDDVVDGATTGNAMSVGDSSGAATLPGSGTTPQPDPDPETGPPGTTSPPMTTGGTSGSSGVYETSGCDFLCDTTGAPPAIECNLFEQDCPEGEKCNPWANDGGNAWNALRCVPVVTNPDEVDEACTVEGSGVSGIDSCVLGAMCWNVDENKEGTCVPHCTGSEQAPGCEDPNRTCQISGDGVLALCLPQCDPLDLGTCPKGQGCYNIGESFLCAPDAGKAGGLFETCEYVNACDPGLVCLNAQYVPCEEGASGCCTTFCNLESPSCPEPTFCTPYYEEGQAPPAYETLGVCVDATP